MLLKVDVGWGQCDIAGPNLSNNPEIVPLTNINYSLNKTFEQGYVPFWNACLNTPHHWIPVSIPPFYYPCVYNTVYNYMSDPIPENCIGSYIKSNNDIYAEGVSTSVDFISNNFISYDLSVAGELLECDSESHNEGKILLRASNDNTLYQGDIISPSTSPPGASFENISSGILQGFGNEVIIDISNYSPNADYNRLQIYSIQDLQVAPSNYMNQSKVSLLMINNVDVRCNTSALSEITFSQNGNIFTFYSENEDGSHPFVNFVWSFGDGATSSLSEPDHEYSIPGNYQVCLDVITDIGCCARRCVNICVLEVPEISIRTNYCSSYTLSVENPDPSMTYTWTIVGGTPSTGTGTMFSTMIPQNGTYTVSVTGENACGSVSSSLTFEVLCSLDPPSCVNQTNCVQIGTDINSVTLLSDLVLGDHPIIPSTQIFWGRTISDLCFTVEGTLVIDISIVNFENTNWFMGPGARIDVTPAGSFGSRWFIDSELKGCTQMWRGIVVQSNTPSFFGNGGMAFLRTTIKDAWHAVELEDNTVFVSSFSNYFDNFTGIHVDGVQLKNIHTQLIGNRFENLGNMLPLYPGQQNWNQRAWFGIYAEGMSKLNVIGLNSSPNRFINLNTGIRTNNVNITASHNIFEDTDLFSSNGIRIQAVPSLSRIVINNTFINLERSIHVIDNPNRSVVEIEENEFLNSRTVNSQNLRGILVQRCPSTSMKIRLNDNFDFVRGYCVNIQGDLSSLVLNDNNITISGHVEPFFVDNVKTKSEINRNIFTVNPNNSYVGTCIRLQNSQKFDLLSNEINGTSTSNGITFISLHGTNRCLVKNNLVNYNHNTAFNIWGTGTSENGFCCNEALNPASLTSRSFGFLGENGMSPVRQNDIYSLVLDGNFGTQTSAGNNWLGTGNFARLVNFGGNSPFDNQFTINITEGLPSSIIPSIISTDWFLDGGIHPTCSNVPDCNITNFTNDTFDPDLTDDSPDPQDTIIVIVDPARPSCEALKDLYERLENIDSTTSPLAYWSVVSLIHKWKVWKGAAWIESCLDSVVTFNPDITPWYDAEKEKEKIYKVDEDLRQDMADVMQEIIELNENLDTIQLDSNLIMPPYVVQWNEHLKDAIDSLTILNNELQADIQTNANSMLTLINNLPTPYGFLSDRKKVWFVEMRYIIGGLNVISQAEWDEIRVIADKCPLTDGQAVYEAMSLLRLLDEQVEIHEDCAPSVPRTVLKSTPEIVKVYPNPGKGLFTFEIPKIFEADQCLILDVNGRTIKQLSVQKNMEKFQVDLTSVKSGVYVYVFKNDNIFVQQGKLIVIE